MKRFFMFQSKSKKPERLEPVRSTTLPKVALSPAETSSSSPTTSRRPTARSEGAIWQSLQVIATEDGLLIRPANHVQHEYLKVAWQKTVNIVQVKGSAEGADWESSSLTIHGILGTMSLFSGSYLLVITGVNDLGNLCSTTRPVYGVKDVAYIPLDYGRATTVINRVIIRLQKPVPLSPQNATGQDVPQGGEAGSLHVKWAPQHLPTTTPDANSILSSSPTSSGYSTPTTSGIAIAPLAKTLADRLSFWKSKSGTGGNEASIIASKTTGDHDTLGELLDDIDNGDTTSIEPNQAIDDIVTAAVTEPQSTEEKHRALEEKVLRETVKQFTKGGMYFSYNFDLSNSLQRKQQQIERLNKQDTLLADLHVLGDWSTLESCQDAQPFKEPLPDTPLWKRIDRKFWWNEYLLQPFIEAELDAYVLPVLQGYFQIAKFHLPLPTDDASIPLASTVANTVLGNPTQPTIEVEYASISRRSRDRAGLRYQRRGIDDDSHVANFVETEAIVRVIREETENVFSFVQIRGSIPLYWFQTGVGLKPPPQLDPSRNADQNVKAMGSHFTSSIQRYGQHTCVNLAEQHGREGVITDAYRNYMGELNQPDAKYHEWDFHAECRGMRYENISKLIRQLERTFEQQGFYWISGSTVMSQQKGVFRVNCIDCLDRTNVVQSAFARHMLTTQLEALALLNETRGTRTEAEQVFNDVWANNGDAISREYAGTSALKGDYTRTGKRDLSGMLNDGINSLARVYTSTFSDWFSQSVIDFMLGYRGTSVFSEFLQKLSSSDPRDVLRLSKVREAAIEHASSLAVLGEERLTAGWTLLSPMLFNIRLADKFEEKILLLTNKAIYIVSYDYSLEKVKMSTRVPLGDIIRIQKGGYILSTLNSQTQDTESNYGMVIAFLAARQDTRVTSYSMRNKYTSGEVEDVGAQSPMNNTLGTTLSKILSNTHSRGEIVTVAFKSLPVDTTQVYSAGANEASQPPPSNAREAITQLVNALAKACEDFGVVDEGFLREEDVVSAAEAQKSTTLFSKFEYNFKRLLWLGS